MLQTPCGAKKHMKGNQYSISRINTKGNCLAHPPRCLQLSVMGSFLSGRPGFWSFEQLQTF